MHVLAVKNRDKAELKAIFDRNGIRWEEHGAELSGRTPAGAIVDPDDPDLVAYVEILLDYAGRPPRDRELMIDYLLLKVREQDWHGVSDAANDLREMDARRRP